jgi:hypothetical protein
MFEAGCCNMAACCPDDAGKREGVESLGAGCFRSEGGNIEGAEGFEGREEAGNRDGAGGREVPCW